MLTPATHKGGAAVFQAREEVDHQPGNFCGRWITVMPHNVLETITQYLSMQDMDNLGRVCRKLQSSLMICGLPIIRHYLSLPKNQQRLYQQMATGNRQLTDLIRKKKLAHGYNFPVQFSPAMCIAFTQSLRQRLISSTAIALEPRGCIEAAPYDNDGLLFERMSMNKNFNRLRLDNAKRCEIAYWKADINGFWSSDHRFSYSRKDVNYLRFDADLELTNVSRVYIRDQRRHVPVVELSIADSPARLTLNLSSKSVFKLADDRKTLLCVRQENTTIYDLERDSHWQCTGRFTSVRDALFCPDGLYIALMRADDVCFLKRSRSGSWVSSGNVNYVKPENDSYACSDKTVVFSPDGCHFLAKCTHKHRWYRQHLLSVHDLYVNAAIGSIDSDGQWYTQNVIRKTIPKPHYHNPSKFAFTQDGKHIIVAGKTDFDAWRLSENGQWIESVKNCCVTDNPDLLEFIDLNMKLASGVMMITLWKHIMIWAVDSNGSWHRQMQELSRYPCFAQISPDGKSLVCHDGSGNIVVWLRDPDNNWHQQAIEIPDLRLAKFNDQSCLLAVAVEMSSFNTDRIILLGLTPKQEWQEKCRLKVDGHIIKLSFSPCGRSMRADYREANKMKRAFWHINPDGSGDNSPT